MAFKTFYNGPLPLITNYFSTLTLRRQVSYFFSWNRLCCFPKWDLLFFVTGFILVRTRFYILKVKVVPPLIPKAALGIEAENVKLLMVQLSGVSS